MGVGRKFYATDDFFVLRLFFKCSNIGKYFDKLSNFVPGIFECFDEIQSLAGCGNVRGSQSTNPPSCYVSVTGQSGDMRLSISRSETAPLAMDLMRRMADANVPKIAPLQPQFKFIDLFVGIGGLRRSFEEIGGKCIFTAE